jgi:hypothetical protein
MDYPAEDFDSLIRIWTFSVMMKGERGILQPISLNVETQTMMCEKVDGNLADNIDLVTDENRDVLIESLIDGVSAMCRKGLVHLNLVPRNIWIRCNPPSLMIGGFDDFRMDPYSSTSGWQTQGVGICLYLLRGTQAQAAIKQEQEIAETNVDDGDVLLNQIKQQLSETVSIFVIDPEKRGEVLENAFTLFSMAMKTNTMDIEDAKKYVMFSLYIALNLSMIKIDYPKLPPEIGDIEWYKTFISSLK